MISNITFSPILILCLVVSRLHGNDARVLGLSFPNFLKYCDFFIIFFLIWPNAPKSGNAFNSKCKKRGRPCYSQWNWLTTWVCLGFHFVILFSTIVCTLTLLTILTMPSWIIWLANKTTFFHVFTVTIWFARIKASVAKTAVTWYMRHWCLVTFKSCRTCSAWQAIKQILFTSDAWNSSIRQHFTCCWWQIS